MSNNMKIGAVIKLSPEMFKENFKLDGHFGSLGYPGIMRDWVFKVVDNIPHSYHGDTVLCEPVNVVGAEGQLRLLTKDVCLAVMKVTLDYKILNNRIGEITSLETEILQLQERRKVLASKFKLTGRTMKANQLEIDSAQNKLKELRQTTDIFITKINKTVTVDSSLLAKTDELEMFLASIVSEHRSKLRGKDNVVVKTIQGTEVKKVNGVFTKANTFGEVYEKGLTNFIKANKLPVFKDKNYLGIEVECLHSCSRGELEEMFIKARLHKNVQIVGDGSIVADAGYNASEIRILVHEDEMEYVLTRIGKVLSSRKVDAYANRSCGLHVHLDARNRDVEKMYANLFRVQPILRLSQPQSRLTSTYCRENKDATFKACRRGDNERYSVINTHAYDKQKSLEVRVHEGTTNVKDIINWCKFLTAVVSKDIKFDKVINNVSELKTVAPSIPTEYVESRIEKFGDDLSA